MDALKKLMVPTNESKEKIQKFWELWGKISYLIRSITKNSDDYDEKHIKFKFDSNDRFEMIVYL